VARFPWKRYEDKLVAEWAAYLDDPDRGTVGAFDEEFALAHGVPSVHAVTQKRARLGLQLDGRGGAQQQPMASQGVGHGTIDEARELDLLDYTHANGVYYFPVAGRIFPIPEEQWDRVCAMYSEMGENRTAKEAARELALPVSVLKRCLRQAGQYKTNLPVSREVLLHEEAAEIVERTLAAKEREVVARFEREKRARWEREYLALKQRYLSDQRFIEDAHEIMRDLEPPKIIKTNGKVYQDAWSCHIPTADEHIGMLVWSDETFAHTHYDSESAVDRLMRHADLAADWIESQPGDCATVYRSFLGDLFHAITGETEHGTHLHQDSRTQKVWKLAAEAVIYGIERLAQVAGLVVVNAVPGNHEGPEESFKFFHSLDLYFRNRPDVDIRVHPQRFTAFRVADTLHVLDHGYGVGSLGGWKARALAEGVAREAAEFNGAEWIYTYYGHLHKKEVAPAGAHHELKRLPALCETDDYATDLRLPGRACAILYRLDARGRIGSETTLYADDLALVASN
jgi:hypothetical protein